MNIPTKRLYTGAPIPAIGLGTFGSDHVAADAVARAVGQAIDMGYRFIDCAACYGNEDAIGEALSRKFAGGVKREDMFILSKLWNDMHAPDDVRAACLKSLKDLRLEYLDCYLVHWPFPNAHAPGCDQDSRNPDARPYIHAEFMRTWRAMEALIDDGLVKHIGVSNMTIPKLELVLNDARIKPAVHEMELHPCFQQGELYQYCVDHGVMPVGYCPIGSPARPERDRTARDFADTQMPQILEIAASRGMHPATLCVKWAYQRGQIPIPFSTNPNNMRANLECALTPPLTGAEMDAIRACERNSRLIKGQVFLWPGASDWIDLWDADGAIAK